MTWVSASYLFSFPTYPDITSPLSKNVLRALHKVVELCLERTWRSLVLDSGPAVARNSDRCGGRVECQSLCQCSGWVTSSGRGVVLDN
jgi:hypothetical protein